MEDLDYHAKHCIFYLVQDGELQTVVAISKLFSWKLVGRMDRRDGEKESRVKTLLQG